MIFHYTENFLRHFSILLCQLFYLSSLNFNDSKRLCTTNSGSIEKVTSIQYVVLSNNRTSSQCIDLLNHLFFLVDELYDDNTGHDEVDELTCLSIVEKNII